MVSRTKQLGSQRLCDESYSEVCFYPTSAFQDSSSPLEHLGLIPPQDHSQRYPEATSFMHPAPFPNKDETGTREDQFVMDPISDEMDLLWNRTAKKNREIFSELFRPVPTNLVRSLSDYKVRPFF